MAFHDLTLSFIALFSEIIGTVSGFGSSTFFVPAAMMVESLHFVLALTAILHVISNLTKLILFKGHISFKNCLPLAFASIVFTGIGASLTSVLPVGFLHICLGIVLMVIAASHIFLKIVVSKNLSLLLTGISGFFTGLVGTGGAIRALALQSAGLEKNAFVFASSFIDFGGDAVRGAIYIRNGYMDWDQWFYIPTLVAAAVLGSLGGRWILSKIRQAIFDRIVTVLVFLSGLSLVVESF